MQRLSTVTLSVPPNHLCAQCGSAALCTESAHAGNHAHPPLNISFLLKNFSRKISGNFLEKRKVHHKYARNCDIILLQGRKKAYRIWQKQVPTYIFAAYVCLPKMRRKAPALPLCGNAADGSRARTDSLSSRKITFSRRKEELPKSSCHFEKEKEKNQKSKQNLNVKKERKKYYVTYT